MNIQSNDDHKQLFKPYSFGDKTLRNRIVMAPMTRQLSPQGVPGKVVTEYYRRRAEGGVGLIITEGTYIDHSAANGYQNVPAIYGRSALNGWKQVVDAVHEAGASIVPQLWHVGAIRRPGMEPDPQILGVGPIDVYDGNKKVVSALTEKGIEEIIESYSRAAVNAQEVGFDGIEVHGAHEYLIDQFLWDVTNQRNDSYGGSIENRTRLACEIIQAIKKVTRENFPIIFRLSQWKIRDYSAKIASSPKEFEKILTLLVEAGVDMFHISTRRYLEPAFAGSDDSLAVWARRLSNKPVICVGSVALNKAYAIAQLRGTEDPTAEMVDLSPVEKLLEHEKIDLVAIGRPLLADAYWPLKVKENRLKEIIPFNRNAFSSTI